MQLRVAGLVFGFLASTSVVSASNPNVLKQGSTCTVVALGAGQDDGPSINSAFQECSKNSKIVLDGYYVSLTKLHTYMFV